MESSVRKLYCKSLHELDLAECHSHRQILYCHSRCHSQILHHLKIDYKILSF